jgi:glycosyltransferase involved in cell wall biosynthesis
LVSISVLIITFNEEKNIRRCLESVKWADEIVVIDSESSDRTVDIAKEYTDKIIVQEWQGYAATKNLGLQYISSEWLFAVDADEEISIDLKEEIFHAVQSSHCDGFFIPRMANFLGKWIKHSGWYPGYVLRLIRKEKAHFYDKRVHEFLEIPEKVKKLENPIFHYTDPTITHYFAKLNRYTSLAAEDLWDQGKHFKFIDLMIRPLHLSFKMYIFKFGFLDGFQGLILAIFSGVYVFVKYAKLWELQNQKIN